MSVSGLEHRRSHTGRLRLDGVARTAFVQFHLDSFETIVLPNLARDMNMKILSPPLNTLRQWCARVFVLTAYVRTIERMFAGLYACASDLRRLTIFSKTFTSAKTNDRECVCDGVDRAVEWNSLNWRRTTRSSMYECLRWSHLTIGCVVNGARRFEENSNTFIHPFMRRNGEYVFVREFRWTKWAEYTFLHSKWP